MIPATTPADLKSLHENGADTDALCCTLLSPTEYTDIKHHSEKLNILSINMNRSNFKLVSLLETTIADCVLIQEPWWGTLVPRCSDYNPKGKASFGTVNHPHWMTFSPPTSLSLDGHPQVITFICK
jgi:hypothetical protein